MVLYGHSAFRSPDRNRRSETRLCTSGRRSARNRCATSHKLTSGQLACENGFLTPIPGRLERRVAEVKKLFDLLKDSVSEDEVLQWYREAHVKKVMES